MRALWSQIVFFSFLIFKKSKSIWPIQKWTKINVHFSFGQKSLGKMKKWKNLFKLGKIIYLLKVFKEYIII